MNPNLPANHQDAGSSSRYSDEDRKYARGNPKVQKKLLKMAEKMKRHKIKKEYKQAHDEGLKSIQYFGEQHPYFHSKEMNSYRKSLKKYHA